MKPALGPPLKSDGALAEVKRVMQLEAEAILKCVDRIETKELGQSIETALQYFQKAFISQLYKIIEPSKELRRDISPTTVMCVPVVMEQ